MLRLVSTLHIKKAFLRGEGSIVNFLFNCKLETGAGFQRESSNGTMEAMAAVLVLSLSLSLILLRGGVDTICSDMMWRVACVRADYAGFVFLLVLMLLNALLLD